MNKRILILGATGRLGKVIVSQLLDDGYKVTVLVRNPQKIQIAHSNLKVQIGEVTSSHDLESALKGVGAVISVLGHGFRTPYPIQEKTIKALIPEMKKAGIDRFVAVTGSDLYVEGDSDTLISKFQRFSLSSIDSYRIQDSISQQKLLEESGLDWTIVRTPVHSNGVKRKPVVTQKKPYIWQTIPRLTISEFIKECLKNGLYVRKFPIIV